MKRNLLLTMVATLLVGLAALGAPSVGDATTLNILSVTAHTGAANFSIWAPINGFAPTNTALLAQTSGYNFDGSDACIGSGLCGVAASVDITTSLGGPPAHFAQTNGGNALGVPVPTDNIATPPLETAGYFGTTCSGNAAVCADLKVDLGYADDAHLESPTSPTACTPITNCQPSGHPFSATFVQANAASGGCLGGTPGRSCFDSGAIYITNIQVTRVPEPATLLLLGAGLLGTAVWSRRLIKG